MNEHVSRLEICSLKSTANRSKTEEEHQRPIGQGSNPPHVPCWSKLITSIQPLVSFIAESWISLNQLNKILVILQWKLEMFSVLSTVYLSFAFNLIMSTDAAFQMCKNLFAFLEDIQWFKLRNSKHQNMIVVISSLQFFMFFNFFKKKLRRGKLKMDRLYKL